MVRVGCYKGRATISECENNPLLGWFEINVDVTIAYNLFGSNSEINNAGNLENEIVYQLYISINFPTKPPNQHGTGSILRLAENYEVLPQVKARIMPDEAAASQQVAAASMDQSGRRCNWFILHVKSSETLSIMIGEEVPAGNTLRFLVWLWKAYWTRQTVFSLWLPVLAGRHSSARHFAES